MKSEVYRKKVDTRDELLVNTLHVIACIKERQDAHTIIPFTFNTQPHTKFQTSKAILTGLHSRTVRSCSVSKDCSKWEQSDVTETGSLSNVGNPPVSHTNEKQFCYIQDQHIHCYSSFILFCYQFVYSSNGIKHYSTNPQSFVDKCFDTNIKGDLIRFTRIFGRKYVSPLQSMSLTSATIYRVTINSSARIDIA